MHCTSHNVHLYMSIEHVLKKVEANTWILQNSTIAPIRFDITSRFPLVNFDVTPPKFISSTVLFHRSTLTPACLIWNLKRHKISTFLCIIFGLMKFVCYRDEYEDESENYLKRERKRPLLLNMTINIFHLFSWQCSRCSVRVFICDIQYVLYVLCVYCVWKHLNCVHQLNFELVLLAF